MHSSMAATGVAGAVPWYRTVTREQWRVLLAAKFGWMLDAMDFMLYTMAVGQLRAYFGFGDDTAGMLGTVTLVMSGVGGAIFGYVADRFGRTRALMGTILIFSLASLGAATSQNGDAAAHLARRCSASAWAANGRRAPCSSARRGRRTCATRRSASCSRAGRSATSWRRIAGGTHPRCAVARRRRWRWLFVVGVVPAFFTLWIRRYVHEPETWTRQRARPRDGRRIRSRSSSAPTLIKRTLLIIALGAAVQFAYWGLFFWLPAFLARPVEQGGAGMGVVGSLPWIIPVQLGAYARLSDVRLHRRSDRTTADVRAVS